jgi:uncharacterized protein (TIGR04255 family)
MQARPAELPDFRNPPVVEVYLSIQFEPIAGFDGTLLSKCYGEFSAAFPKVRYQQPLGHDLEVFGAAVAPVRPTTLQFQIAPDLDVRLALTSEDGARLLQIQPDRLVHNWRRQGKETDYPRYESIREAFDTHTRTFFTLLARLGLPDPVIDQCEISYINNIELPPEQGGGVSASRIFSQLQAASTRDSLPELEDMGLRARYIVRDGERRAVGRLHTLTQPTYQAVNPRPAYRFNLMVRGQPSAPTLDGALAFFDLGRRSIVCAFAALTTPEMHKLWGRTDVAAA